MGSSHWPQYNLNKIVKQSIEKGEPILAVAIKYIAFV